LWISCSAPWPPRKTPPERIRALAAPPQDLFPSEKSPCIAALRGYSAAKDRSNSPTSIQRLSRRDWAKTTEQKQLGENAWTKKPGQKDWQKMGRKWISKASGGRNGAGGICSS
jgi:hypothetical protein